MIKSFEFYFDFGSPYTFIAHKRIRYFEKENNINVKYIPIALGGLLKLAGLRPLIDTPIKGKYMIKDCKLCAKKYEIIFKFNTYFPIITLDLMRCVVVAEKKGTSKIFIDKIFDSIWREGLNLNDHKVIEILLKKININSKKYLTEATNQFYKEELKKRTTLAHNKGVFGAPTFLINNKIFWGQDRLDFVLNEAKE